MYTCRMCDSVFPEPDIKIERGCYESDFGVSGMFADHHYYEHEITICPFCGSEDIGSVPEEDDRIAYYERQGDEYVYFDENEHELFREDV